MIAIDRLCYNSRLRKNNPGVKFAMAAVQLAVVLFSDWGNCYLLPCAAMTAFSVYSGIGAADPLVSFMTMGAVAAGSALAFYLIDSSNNPWRRSRR